MIKKLTFPIPKGYAGKCANGIVPQVLKEEFFRNYKKIKILLNK